MPRRDATLRKSVIAIGAVCAISTLAQSANAQQVPPGLSASADWTGAHPEETASLRREVDGLTHLLRDQQLQIEQQARQLATMQEVLATEQARVPPASVRDIPASYSAAGAAGDCDPEPWIDIGGQYRVMYNASNFDFHPATLDNDQRSQTFFNQRFRTWLEVHPNDRVSGYVQVEMGHVLWGNNYDFPKTYPGPFSPAGDRVGVELRRGYLTYKTENSGVFRAGIQDWHDAFGESYTLGTSGAVDDYDSFGAVLANSVWDFNVGGLSYAGAAPLLPGMNLNAGAFVLRETDVQKADDVFLLALDLDRPVSENHSVGFSVYYLSDHGGYSYPITLPGGGAFDYDSAWDLWIGVRASTVLWAIPVRGFAIYNTGQRKELGGLPTFQHDDAALKLEAGPVPLGIGKLSLQALYSTGDGNPDETRRDGFRTIAQSARDNFGSQGYWSYLVLTSPHGPSDVNDLGVGLQNRGLGLFTVQGKYDYPIYGRLSGTIAAGWLRSDATNPASGSSDMGTELANMFAFDFGGGLTLDFGASVLFTGDFYKTSPAAPRPDDIYEVFTRLQLEF